mmetsp:Transcript_18587/g.26158  ORF Transcript_18587/g.26158 Transcript_18587/m.26158 type:complete len:179 (+) Transcript_18587:49-585(+)
MSDVRDRTTHYDVLGVKPSASTLEIKSKHRLLVLQYHPDKKKQPTDGDRKDKESTEFHRLTEAWECLRDPERRNLYDDSLNKELERDNRILDKAIHIKLSQMKMEICDVDDDDLDRCQIEVSSHQVGNMQYSQEVLYTYNCRCGDYFEILQRDLYCGLSSDLWECKSCSLTMLIDRDI